MESGCLLCPRQCNIPRSGAPGYCGAGAAMVVSRAMLHPWEEPFISGQMGSGTIFFSGCSLRCVFCQNHSISHRIQGREVTADELVRIMHHLFLAGAHNINLVTGAHFTDLIIPALVKARAMGVHIPFIWNSSGYESVATLKKLEGLIDVYLPDFKFMNPEYALRYAGAADYPAKAKLALAEMYRQTGPSVFANGLIKSGMVVRHLVLPGLGEDSKDILDYLSSQYKDTIWISLMNQYYPADLPPGFAEIDRTVTAAEYQDVTDYALFSGIRQALLQTADSQSAAYTPDFALTGLEFLDK